MVNTLVSSMDQEKARFWWVTSAAVDGKAHWLTALTTVGADTTAVTTMMCQSNVSFQRQLHRQTVSGNKVRILQELSSCWDGRPFGHNRHGPKSGDGLLWGLGPHLTQCGLGRNLPLYQVASWSIQPFGHNCKNATLLRVGIPLRTIFIPSLVIKTFTVRVHWIIARYQLKSSKQCFKTIRETF